MVQHTGKHIETKLATLGSSRLFRGVARGRGWAVVGGLVPGDRSRFGRARHGVGDGSRRKPPRAVLRGVGSRSSQIGHVIFPEPLGFDATVPDRGLVINADQPGALVADHQFGCVGIDAQIGQTAAVGPAESVQPEGWLAQRSPYRIQSLPPATDRASGLSGRENEGFACLPGLRFQ